MFGNLLLSSENVVQAPDTAGKIILLLALMMGIGILLGKLARMLKLPSITGYLLAGILIGPFALGRIHFGFNSIAETQGFEIINIVALGFITFSVGSEFKLNVIKTVGKKAIIIAVAQAVITALFVDAMLLILHFFRPDIIDASTAIVLGSIAAVTEPAAILMVTRQYRARGDVTKTLHFVVEISEVISLIIFYISLAIAEYLEGAGMSPLAAAAVPALEIAISLGIGAIFGIILALASKVFKSSGIRYCIVLTLVLCCVAACEILSANLIFIKGIHVGVSELMACLIMGIVFCNTHKKIHSIISHVEYWTVPLFIVFFVLVGARLDFSMLTWTAIISGLVYIVSRVIGKYFGAYSGSRLVSCEKNVRKYLGPSLLPQVAMALALVSIVQHIALAQANIISAIVIFSALIYELAGPFAIKFSLQKAGEITPQNSSSEDDYSDECHVEEVESELLAFDEARTESYQN